MSAGSLNQRLQQQLTQAQLQLEATTTAQLLTLPSAPTKTRQPAATAAAIVRGQGAAVGLPQGPLPLLGVPQSRGTALQNVTTATAAGGRAQTTQPPTTAETVAAGGGGHGTEHKDVGQWARAIDAGNEEELVSVLVAQRDAAVAQWADVQERLMAKEAELSAVAAHLQAVAAAAAARDATKRQGHVDHRAQGASETHHHHQHQQQGWDRSRSPTAAGGGASSRTRVVPKLMLDPRAVAAEPSSATSALLEGLQSPLGDLPPTPGSGASYWLGPAMAPPAAAGDGDGGVGPGGSARGREDGRRGVRQEQGALRELSGRWRGEAGHVSRSLDSLEAMWQGQRFSGRRSGSPGTGDLARGGVGRSGAAGQSRSLREPSTLDDLLAKYGSGEKELGGASWDQEDASMSSFGTGHQQRQQQQQQYDLVDGRPASRSPELQQQQQQHLIGRSRLSPDLDHQQHLRELVQLRGALIAADAANERLRSIVGVLRKEMETLQAAGVLLWKVPLKL